MKNDNKRFYEEPSVEVICFYGADIITMSDGVPTELDAIEDVE